MKIVAGIILYNPNLDTLKKSIQALSGIVDKIILVDNASDNIDDVRKIAKRKSVSLIKNKENLGVAEALNILMENAFKMHATNLLTLDQDSIIDKKMIPKMEKYLISSEVAIVCPRFVDINKKKQRKVKSEIEYEYVNRCITSGSVMNLPICNKIGRFDASMFIDYVDFDYCKRIQLAGYKIIRVNSCELTHAIGKRSSRKFFWIDVYPTNHSVKRVYYFTRNLRYYLLKYKGQFSLKELINERVIATWKTLSIVLYEDDKKEKLKAIRKAKKDAKIMAEGK